MIWIRSVIGFVIVALIAAYSPEAARAAANSCSIGAGSVTPGLIIWGKCGTQVQSQQPGSSSSSPPPVIIRCVDTGVICGLELFCVTPGHRLGLRTLAITLTGPTAGIRTGCAGDPPPTAPATLDSAVRQQVIRLLPPVAIGSAWTSRAIVNAEAILWAQTPLTRDLPPATVVGRPIRLRLAFDHAAWNFGDGATDTTATPGRPYDRVGDPCATAQCPHYYGHTFTETGTRRLSLRVTWRASFSADGVHWQAIPGLVTGPPVWLRLTVVESRGVLVPD